MLPHISRIIIIIWCHSIFILFFSITLNKTADWKSANWKKNNNNNSPSFSYPYFLFHAVWNVIIVFHALLSFFLAIIKQYGNPVVNRKEKGHTETNTFQISFSVMCQTHAHTRKQDRIILPQAKRTFVCSMQG